MSERFTRVLMIHLENTVIGDGFFAPEVASTLREYAGLIDAGEKGRRSGETYESTGGTRLTAVGAGLNGG